MPLLMLDYCQMSEIRKSPLVEFIDCRSETLPYIIHVVVRTRCLKNLVLKKSSRQTYGRLDVNNRLGVPGPQWALASEIEPYYRGDEKS